MIFKFELFKHISLNLFKLHQMETFPPDLRVSTMTAISKLSVDINLENLYDNFKINDVIKYIEFRDKLPKGFSKKALRKKRKKEPKKVFFNQATLHIMSDKLVNVKITTPKTQVRRMSMVIWGPSGAGKKPPWPSGIKKAGPP